MTFKKVGILQKGLSMDPAYPRHEVLIDTTLPDNLKEQPVYIHEPVFIPKYIANWLNELKYFCESHTKELTLKTALLGYIFDSENFITFPDFIPASNNHKATN
ncbi:hypothetical protein [Oenococcus oeni]|uniref:hypothetical protein n=2 Tax=Oenococcus oeni TaxID=1247 RepID=UPI000277775C|nr:hypothetical protein [Oenococcus oeni]EJN93102.1 hypothetical protein AWRIB304_26 [Oenococcus oeni AWRIB304]KER91145.1 hypothetical protein HS16_03505 [Oenococcus oeni]KER91737.1 hypothetical protein HS16_01765 [Oenococcus oeni]KER96619.1 hypothetical protein HT64_02510 [Oenococcus oeni]KGH60511.1 hypothetical protein X467_06080 [Oenococcus oeni S28]